MELAHLCSAGAVCNVLLYVSICAHLLHELVNAAFLELTQVSLKLVGVLFGYGCGYGAFIRGVSREFKRSRVRLAGAV